MFQAHNLACRRPHLVFRDLSFTLESGAVLCLTGPNGSGKSSLLRMLAGLLPLRQGSLHWQGQPVDFFQHRRRLHYIGHRDAAKPEFTVGEMVEYWDILCASRFRHQSDLVLPPLRGELEGGSIQVEITSHLASSSRGEEFRKLLLEKFSLETLRDKPIRYLSAGQRRRLALTRLLLEDVPLWLLDEPMTSLDQEGQKVLNGLIANHRVKGGIVVMAMHHECTLPDAQHLTLTGAA